MKRLVLVFFIVLMLFAVISCSEGKSPSASKPGVTTKNDITTANGSMVDTSATTTQVIPPVTTANDDVIVFAKGGETEYRIVHNSTCKGKAKTLIQDVKGISMREAGVALSSVIDTSSDDVSAYEILVGDTNRPETASAIEMLGDNDYILVVINKKLVLYSKNEEGYEILHDYISENCFKNGVFFVDTNVNMCKTVVTEIKSDVTFENGKRISFTVNPNNERYKFEFILGTRDEQSPFGYIGYNVTVTEDEITFYEQRSAMTALATKPVSLSYGRDYEIIFEMDGNWCRFFLVNDAEGVEPWPEFELNVGRFSADTLLIRESVGYSAKISEISNTDYTAKSPEGVSYKNPVLPGYADPDILYYEGKYYLYGTSVGYDVYESEDLVNWTFVRKTLTDITWKNYSYGIFWAPDVEYINGKFYMAVSIEDRGFGFAVSDSPTGPFKLMGDKPLLTSTIDGHFFIDDDGKVYLYYTSWATGKSYGIYGVELDTETMTPKWETEKKLIAPTGGSWDSREGSVAEGAYMLKKDGVYFLVYSGCGYESDYYAVGYATSSSPLGPFKKYSNNPVLQLTSDAHGVGHCSFTYAPDGETLIIAYHAHFSLDKVHTRPTYLDLARIVKNEYGEYILEVYGPTTQKHVIPSGKSEE